MRQRLYFLLPSVDCAKQVVNDLLLARVEDRNIRVVAKDGTALEGLHEASVLQTTDLAHSAEMGLIVGGIAGVLAGVVALFNPVPGLNVNEGVILVAALLGAAFGAWASSLIGTAIPNSRLSAFRKEIDQGRILMMVDAPRGRSNEINDLIRARHPDAAPRGAEPTIPAFP